jgi:DNA-directed RNA polymerase specialized sigma24 family protein
MVDALRREERRKRAGRPGLLDELECDAVDRRTPTPSEVASAAEIRELVKRALLELQLTHPDEMEAVLLKVFDGESWTTIQECLGLSPVKRARTLCARGLDLLRQRVEGLVGDGALGTYLGA